MPRSFADAPGLSQQMSFAAWVPGLAFATDILQLLASVGKRAKVKRWLDPGKEVWREGSDQRFARGPHPERGEESRCRSPALSDSIPRPRSSPDRPPRP